MKQKFWQKKCWVHVTLFVFVCFLIGCSTGVTPIDTASSMNYASEIKARNLAEVDLITVSGEMQRGKIVSLQGDFLKFLPFPYWNVTLSEIKLNDIHTIKILKTSNKSGAGFTIGFCIPYIIVGTIGLASGKYDSDFSAAILLSFLLGGIGGLVGLLMGGLSDFGKKSDYVLAAMNLDQKRYAVMKIMGYR